MKKILNLALAIVGLLLLAFIIAFEINTIHPFITLPTQHLETINFIISFGTMIVLGLWIFVYFMGSGPIRVLLAILIFIIMALGIIAFGFPEIIIKVLS